MANNNDIMARRSLCWSCPNAKASKCEWIRTQDIEKAREKLPGLEHELHDMCINGKDITSAVIIKKCPLYIKSMRTKGEREYVLQADRDSN